MRLLLLEITRLHGAGCGHGHRKWLRTSASDFPEVGGLAQIDELLALEVVPSKATQSLASEASAQFGKP